MKVRKPIVRKVNVNIKRVVNTKRKVLDLITHHLEGE